MHAECFAFVARAARDITARRLKIVELGSRDVNGSVRPIFEGHDYTGVDIAPGKGVDVVGDGATWGETAAYDLGICCEVLEHAEMRHLLIENLRRIVRPGGMLIITAASDPRPPHSAIDGNPLTTTDYYGTTLYERETVLRRNPTAEFYANVSPGELCGWLEGCPYVNVEAEHGDVRAIVVVALSHVYKLRLVDVDE